MWASIFHRILSVCSSRLGINTANDEEPLQLATSSSSPGDISQVLSRNASWTLLDLPLEIKTKIYEYAFEQAQLEIKSTTEPGVGSRATYCHGSRAVTMVSKQVRSEAQPVFIARTPCSYPRSRWFDRLLEQGRKSTSQCHSRCKRSRTEIWSTIRTVAQTTTRVISRVFLGPPIFAHRVDEQTPNSEKDHLRPGTSGSRGGSCSMGRHYCEDGRENDGRRSWRTE